ncbi:MAG: GNAT family N-acetyltransferase [Nitrospiraceae bacterium]
MRLLKFQTSRLDLIAGTLELVQAELDDPVRFATLLGAKTPEQLAAACERLESRLTIGNGGFKGAPTADGTVELGYSILPEHQRHGCATEAVSTLVASAYSDPPCDPCYCGDVAQSQPVDPCPAEGGLLAGAGKLRARCHSIRTLPSLI